MSDGPNKTDEAQEGRIDGRLSAEQVRSEQAEIAAAVQTGQENKAAAGSKTNADEMPWWKEWIELLVRAGFWALLIYLFVFQVSVVEGTSMDPTFRNHDKLVIDKLTYRFSSIRRFDVVVFETVDLDKPVANRHVRDYIKRVIGLPGEKVTIRYGRVEVEGRALKEDFLPVSQSTQSVPQDTFVVPEGHYFVMGDNRLGSHDSRHAGMGFVPAGQIKGLVRVRWWPWDRAGWLSREEERQF
ncbi:MAG TPA: signal peptidase I [Planctomycetota bacterium]|nr:signal peptidase I [Planctomycetota bacterium]